MPTRVYTHAVLPPLVEELVDARRPIVRVRATRSDRIATRLVGKSVGPATATIPDSSSRSVLGSSRPVQRVQSQRVSVGALLELGATSVAEVGEVERYPEVVLAQ